MHVAPPLSWIVYAHCSNNHTISLFTAHKTSRNLYTDQLCHVFEPEGGGISFSSPPTTDALDPTATSNQLYGKYEFIGLAQIDLVGSTCADASCAELLLVLRNLTQDVCNTINDDAGISGNLYERIYGLGTLWLSFAGSYSYTEAGSITDNTLLKGKHFGCFYQSNASLGNYSFYYTLIER